MAGDPGSSATTCESQIFWNRVRGSLMRPGRVGKRAAVYTTLAAGRSHPCPARAGCRRRAGAGFAAMTMPIRRTPATLTPFLLAVLLAAPAVRAETPPPGEASQGHAMPAAKAPAKPPSPAAAQLE